MTPPGTTAGTRRVEVAVDPPYTVHVGDGVLATLPDVIARLVRPTRVFVLCDDVVGPLHGESVALALAPLATPIDVHHVPAGERSKSLATLGAVLVAMADARLDRGSLVVALGGGVIGDLGGFAAATYMRGLPYLQVPTTVLAMVDSSVGGKTGVNLPHGKNLVGAFWQPLAVVADLATLATLPPAERRHGGVELFKAGLLGDAAVVRAFGSGATFGAVVDDPVPGLAEWIARGVAVKARVVADDPRERGARATLNLGHTIGHALESLSDHALAHGEAVAYGLVAAAEIGARRGLLDWRPDAEGLLRWVAPKALPEASVERLLALVERDKKQIGNRRKFVLLEDIGQPVVVDDVSDAEIACAWKALQEVGR